jgi:hypothetical protein
MKLIHIFSAFISLLIHSTSAIIAQNHIMVKTEVAGGIPFEELSSHKSWKTATYDVQTAIDSLATNGGGTIWIAGGTYYPTTLLAANPSAPNPPLKDPDDPESGADERQRSFIMASGLSVTGGFIGTEESIDERPDDLFGQDNSVILSGDIGITNQMEDNCYHVVIFPPEADETAILQNIIVSDGYADGPDAYFAKTGAGVHMREGGLLQNCKITGNISEGSGGGVYLYKGGTVRQCEIYENKSANLGGGVYSNLGGKVSFSAIYMNTSGIASSDGKGGGIFTTSDGTLEGIISNCYIVANTSEDNGGGVGTYKGGLFINDLIANNETTGKGGGIYLQEGGMVVNNTIVRNKGDIGAGIYCNDGGAIHNSAVWGNTTPYSSNNQVYLYDDASTSTKGTADFCAFQNGSENEDITNLISLSSDNTGTGLHPEFRYPVSFYGVPQSDSQRDELLKSDYRLNLSSALLDAGNPNPDASKLPIPDSDLDSSTRVIKTAIDIGAYETLYYTVNTSINAGNGTIDPSGSVNILAEQDVQFSITPEVNYKITSFIINNISCLEDIVDCGSFFTYTSQKLSNDLDVTVEFGIVSTLTEYKKDSLRIFPIPTEDKLFIEGVSISTLKIYSLSGILVKSITEPPKAAIDVSRLAEGLYILTLKDKNQKNYSVKFIKK